MNRLPVIDFHTHCLPGMDDGSESVETSIQMLRMMRDDGTDFVLATPHYYRKRESISSFLERRTAAFESLSTHLEADVPKLIPCAETAFYFGMEDDPDLNELCAFGTSILLLEMPFSAWTDYEVNAVEHLCLDRGFTLVLAHYERFTVNRGNAENAERILRLPVRVQINAASLLPRFTRRRWLQMFRNGSAHLLGSDCHDLTRRKPNLGHGRAVIEKSLGREALQAIDACAAELLQQTGSSVSA